MEADGVEAETQEEGETQAAPRMQVVGGTDTLDFDASGNLTAHNGQHSTQAFAFHDSLGGCYRADVGTLNGVVSSYDSGNGCPDHRNHVYWFSHPDGSPDNGDIVPVW